MRCHKLAWTLFFVKLFIIMKSGFALNIAQEDKMTLEGVPSSNQPSFFQLCRDMSNQLLCVLKERETEPKEGIWTGQDGEEYECKRQFNVNRPLWKWCCWTMEDGVEGDTNGVTDADDMAIHECSAFLGEIICGVKVKEEKMTLAGVSVSNKPTYLQLCQDMSNQLLSVLKEKETEPKEGEWTGKDGAAYECKKQLYQHRTPWKWCCWTIGDETGGNSDGVTDIDDMAISECGFIPGDIICGVKVSDGSISKCKGGETEDS